MDVGVDLFVGCLEFRIAHRDETLVVVEHDGAKAHLVENAVFVAKNRPEQSIETDSIEALYDGIAARRPEMLPPDPKTITARPGDARDALIDETQVCVVLRQW